MGHAAVVWLIQRLLFPAQHTDPNPALISGIFYLGGYSKGFDLKSVPGLTQYVHAHLNSIHRQVMHIKTDHNN